MLVPYDYQNEAVEATLRYLEENADGNPIIALPTGTGKALVIAELLKRIYSQWPGFRVLILTHVKELVGQNHAELLEQWPTAPAGIYSAGLRKKQTHFPITFAGIASVAKNLDKFTPIHLVIIDECHLLSDKDETLYQKTLKQLKVAWHRMRVVGLTATPYRAGLGLLTEGKIFTDIVIDYTEYEKFNQLLDDGYMCPLVPAKTETELDVHTVAVQGGDYVLSELAAAVDVESITRSALEEARRKAWGRRHWLVFCVSVAHAEHACEILNELGVPALCIHNNMPSFELAKEKLVSMGIPPDPKAKDARGLYFAAFKAGYVGAIVGVGIFTTGFNFRPVDCIIILRPTKSASLWVQILGRGTRTYFALGYDISTREGRLAAIAASTKHNCLVLDFAANTRELGPINDPKIPRKKGKKGSSMVPYKVCPHCQTYNHTRARVCIYCQAEFPVSTLISDQASQEELIRRHKAPPPPVSYETFTVNSIHASKHIPRDPTKTPALLIKYYCGKHVFTEYLNLEHVSPYARKKARDTWRNFSSRGRFDEFAEEPPATVDEAVQLFPDLPKPIAIRVLIREKFPEVVAHDFQEYLGSEIESEVTHIPTDDEPF